MKLYAKCLPEYFNMLDQKRTEFRQIESIVLENQVTGEKREYLVSEIRKVDDQARAIVEMRYPLVDWDKDLPIIAIDLGDELDRNDIIKKASCSEPHIAEPEKRWCAVGD